MREPDREIATDDAPQADLALGDEPDVTEDDEVLVFPASFAQQRLWFIDRFDPGSASYNVPLSRRIEGPLDVGALERSIDEIVRRHEALRTTFSVVGGKPVQVIGLHRPSSLPCTDLTGMPAAQREERVRHLATEEARRPFDLARGPVLRAALLKLGGEEHVLLLTMHHIVADGWSVGVFFRELRTLYDAYSTGADSLLPELPVQYADYALWQREGLQGETLERQLAYWRERLADAPTLELPTDRPRPAVQTSNGAGHSFELSSAAYERLKALGRQEGATPFMALLAVFNVLLHRYTGQTDLVVGTPVAGRSQRDLEGLIGMFVNTLVLRTAVEGDASFRGVLGRVRETALGAYAHQEVPFEKLVEELRPERDPSRTPFFQVMFTLQKGTSAKPRLAGLALRSLRVSRETAKFDLTVSLREGKQGVRGKIGYNTDLFEAATIERMGAHFGVLLDGLLATPDRPVSTVPLLTETERRRLAERNRTATAYPRDARVDELFEAQAARTPEAIALVDGEETLSYAALDRRADRLATRLRRGGVGTGALVGVLMERSPELIVSLLAVLKAGAAYLPLDPTYPAERLTLMLRDGQAGVLLVHGRTAGRAPSLDGLRVLDVAADVETGEPGGADEPAVGLSATPRSEESGVGPSDRAGERAYVIYTSGSTGRPKGVAVPHRAIARLVRDTDYVRLGPGDAVAHLSNAAFDAATFEVWGALLNGARLVLLDADVVLAPGAFAAALRRHGVTTAFLTTALFNVVAREAPAAFAPLRAVLFGGEAVDPQWVRAVQAAGPPARLLHVYGPTETTTFATWHEVGAVAAEAATIPIGKPIANTRVYVLDGSGHPVPDGVAGELYVGGDGVALGYVGRAEETAERFVGDPFVAGSRVYRTGDLVRWREPGGLEFVGRLDRQVKIRGFRIEPAEIEAVVGSHPAVEACAVEVGAAGQRQLVAYVVVREGASASPSELRAYLKGRVPGYMVPSAFVLLDALPLTPNGKIDRRALPAPDSARDEQEAAFVAPRDAIEARLIEIWVDVLGQHPIGVRDDFFDLGGHSLLAVELVARIERAFGQSVPLSALFEAPTVDALRRLLQEEQVPVSWAALVPIRTTGLRTPLFCVHSPPGFVFQYATLARHLDSDQPVYALQGQGVNGSAVTHRSVEEMAAQYVEEVRSVQSKGPYLLASSCVGGFVALEMAQQFRAEGEEVALLAMFDPPGPGPNRALRIRPGELAHKPFYRYCLAKGFLALDRPVPPRLRYAYMRFRYREVLSSYQPAAYPGGLTLIRQRRRNPGAAPDRGWGRVFEGGVDVFEVEGPHGLLEEPYVAEVARHLTAQIHEALPREER